jgi:hypothetical protein
VTWADEEKLKKIAAHTIIDPGHLDEQHVWESGWLKYGKQAQGENGARSQAKGDSTSVSKSGARGLSEKGNVSGDSVQQVMDKLLKQSENNEKHVVEATRSIPSEDAFIPCINLVISHHTKVSECTCFLLAKLCTSATEERIRH